MIKKTPISKQARTRRLERFLAVTAVITIIIAWFAGVALEASDLQPAIEAAWPEAGHFERVSGDTFAAYQDAAAEQLLGYVTVGEAAGYGGPLQLAVAVDLGGEVVGTAVVSHKETPSFFARVEGGGFLLQLWGKSFGDPFQLDEDLDGVSGATVTSRALAEAALQGSRLIAVEQLGETVLAAPPPPIQFGMPEITVLALFAVGYFAHRPKFKYKKQARWLMLLTGLFVLGFWYNLPLTISKINSFLLGFWPQWQTNLYWYFLLGGILFVLTADNKNAYCAWFCPFGAAQECLGVIGGAKRVGLRQYRRLFVWLQRGLAWLAIVLALLFRNPGVSSYEVFGTLFSLTGSTVLFALTGIVLVMSLFFKRPWCNFLCPLDPVYDLIRLVRGWSLELWRTVKQTASST